VGAGGGQRGPSERVARALRSRADGDGLIRAVDLSDDSVMPETSVGSALALPTPGLEERSVRAVWSS
jgi:hypothetical protein